MDLGLPTNITMDSEKGFHWNSSEVLRGSGWCFLQRRNKTRAHLYISWIYLLWLLFSMDLSWFSWDCWPKQRWWWVEKPSNAFSFHQPLFTAVHRTCLDCLCIQKNFKFKFNALMESASANLFGKAVFNPLHVIRIQVTHWQELSDWDYPLSLLLFSIMVNGITPEDKAMESLSERDGPDTSGMSTDLNACWCILLFTGWPLCFLPFVASFLLSENVRLSE